MPSRTNNLRLRIQTKDCNIPTDERERLEGLLTPLAEAVAELPTPELMVEVIYHPRSRAYHVEFTLKLPGRNLRAGAADAYLDTALERGIQELTTRAAAYAAHPD